MDASFLTGSNATYIAELYAAYLKDPAAVDASWTSFFRDLDEDEAALMKSLEGASWAPSDAGIIGVADSDAPPAKGAKPNGKAPTVGAAPTGVSGQAEASIHALQLIRAYRARGHQVANRVGLQDSWIHGRRS